MKLVGPFQNVQRLERQGFTLLETLLTVAIISALSIIIISSVNPFVILATSRNGMRFAHLNDLLGGIAAYTIDNQGALPPAVLLPPVSGSTSFSGAYIIDNAFEDVQSIFAADIDGDADIDVVGGTKKASGEVSWWEHSGAGTPSVRPITWTKHVVDTGFKGWVVSAADIDGDGPIDIIAADKDGNRISWWRNPGGASPIFGDRTDIEGNYTSVRSLHVVDIGGDAKPDILAGSDEEDTIQWWRNSDWESKTIETANNEFIGEIRGVDIDGGGTTDVVGAYKSNVTWWVNDGDPWQDNWTQYDIDTSSDRWADIDAGDIDIDASTRMDVVGISTSAGVRWWENDGNPYKDNWTEHIVTTDFGGSSLVVIDVTLDGKRDIVGASDGGDKLVWWENKGAGLFNGGTFVIESGAEVDGIKEIFVVDIDGDSAPDIVAAMEGSDTIAWWNNLRTIGTSPPAPVAAIDVTGKPICREGVSLATCDANGGVSLDVLIPGYIAAIPVDAIESDPLMTGYEIRLFPGEPKVFLSAPLAELEKTIGLTGPVGIANCLVWEVINAENTCVLFQ